MKLGILSDIHGNLPALLTVLEALKECDFLLCAGDITGIGPYPNQVIDILTDLPNFEAVRGNHDQFLLDESTYYPNTIVASSVQFTQNTVADTSLAYLEKLPEIRYFDLDGTKIMMVHASPWNHLHEYVYPDYPDFDRFQEVQADIIVLGHTHVALSKMVGEKTIINPGAVGLARDTRGKAGCAILDLSSMNTNFYHLDYPYLETLDYLVKEHWPPEFAHFIKPGNNKL